MMKRFFRVLPPLAAVALSLSCTTLRTPEPVRVLSYNVRNCRGLDDYESINVERIARVIRGQSPDVAAIQELDRQARRSGQRDILQELAAATGMIGSYGEAIAFQGGAYGVGILSKKRPVRSYRIPLPGEEEARVLLVCEFDSFVFFCTHLSLTAESRQAAAEIISRERAKFAKPVLLAGDFNAQPESEALREFDKSWQRASPLLPTFPADRPDRIIDYIFVSAGTEFQAADAAVVNEPVASDHRPVFASVSFR